MELKVWVEGIQRIVCGVNGKTTCQDVVYALAHATGKTGRFTLIERWRNSERLLAPNEQPLKVLLKWGEHSTDVQFILQWAPLDSGGAKAPAKHDTHNEYTFAKNNPSVMSPGSAQSNITAPKQKSTPFSSNVGNMPSLEDESMKRKEVVPSVGVVRGIPQRVNDTLSNSISSALDFSANGKVINSNSGSNNKTLSGGGPDSTFDLDSSPGKKLKDLNLSSPPPYREPPNPSKSLAHSPGGVSAVNKGLPPYREPPPPNLSHQQVQMQQQQRVSGSGSSNILNNHQLSHLINSNNQSGNSSATHVSGSSGNQATSSSAFDPNSTNPTHRTTEPYSSLNFLGEKADNVTTSKTKDYSVTNGDISALNQNGSLPMQASALSSSNTQYQDLVRLINLQREKLTAQHAEMTQYDAEIMFWEGKAREQQRHLEFITKEIARLELVSAQQESQVLSLLHLEEENELVKQQSDTLKSEIDSLRTEFDNCEKEISNCKAKMALLTNELHVQHVSMKQRQEDWMQRETNTLAEIDRLKKELELARRETEAVTDLSGSLDAEVSTVEADLAGKKKQMERLINAMKEANLQSLTIQPPDELIDGGIHHRSGSTRRMIGSPRQLENAAPTSKNPHGVWV